MRACLGLLGLALLFRQSGAEARLHPSVDDIRSIALSGKRLAVATRGGLVLYEAGDPKPRSLGWGGLIDGKAPSDVWRSGRVWLASAGEAVAEFESGRLTITSTSPRSPRPVSVDEGRFVVPERPIWPMEPFLPAPSRSRGTHVSAVCGNTEAIVAAWYGDGLWRHDGQRWERLQGAPKVPHVAAMACSGEDLAVATQEGALWWRRSGKWNRLPLPTGPRGSIYSLGSLRQRIFGGSFDDGLQVLDHNRWRQVRAPTISTDHPRDLVAFRRSLYVRHSTGTVDRYDGTRWLKSAFRTLPRREASCLGLGPDALLVGQYGGWSAFDGARWRHSLTRPELTGAIVTALAGRGNDTWIGTQRNGLFRYSARTGTIAVFDQRHDLADDWIRTLLVDRGGVTAGTFIGGAFAWVDGRFLRLTPEVFGEATAIVRSPDGALFIGSREGLWKVVSGRAMRVPLGGIDRLDVQALLATPTSLWIAMPIGVASVPWDEL